MRHEKRRELENEYPKFIRDEDKHLIGALWPPWRKKRKVIREKREVLGRGIIKGIITKVNKRA